MALTLDHIFILTESGAPVAEKLVGLGLLEGKSRRHSGQGTANRLFQFPGFAIELLFVVDKNEALTGAGRHLQLLPRSREAGASPFGFIVRAESLEDLASIEHWDYYPDYFNSDLCFHVGSNSSLLAEKHQPTSKDSTGNGN